MLAHQYNHQMLPKTSTEWPKVANVYMDSWFAYVYEIHMIFPLFAYYLSYAVFDLSIICILSLIGTCFHYYDDLCEIFMFTFVLNIKL